MMGLAIDQLVVSSSILLNVEHHILQIWVDLCKLGLHRVT